MTNRLKQDLESLSDESRWAIEKADGYMDLKMWDQALQELDKVSESERSSLAYQHYRLRLAIENHDWDTSTRLSTALHDSAPEEPTFWVERAYVARRAESIQVARTILHDALVRFPEVAVIPFNLACYECQLGDLQLAREYLDAACKIDPAYRTLALEDEDLKPLWNELA